VGVGESFCLVAAEADPRPLDAVAERRRPASTQAGGENVKYLGAGVAQPGWPSWSKARACYRAAESPSPQGGVGSGRAAQKSHPRRHGLYCFSLQTAPCSRVATIYVGSSGVQRPSGRAWVCRPRRRAVRVPAIWRGRTAGIPVVRIAALCPDRIGLWTS